MNGTMQPQTTGQDTFQNEPGGQDNRLSLDPSNPKWSDTVGAWKDGKKYTLKVEVRQISPGEFEVTDAKATDESEPDDSDTEESAEESSNDGYTGNPALRDL